MKNKNLIIGLGIAVVVVGILLIGRPFCAKRPVKLAVPREAAKAGKIVSPAPAKKAISKDKGALTVKITDSKKRDIALRIRAFKSADSKSSIYAGSFTANRMAELSPGTYDIEIDTTPQIIYKNIKVNKGQENMTDLGSITGAIDVKALNVQKVAAYYPYKILYAKSNDIALSATTNRPVEIMPGDYDIEIGTLPKQVKKDLRVDAGRQTIIDLGCTTGTINVKAIDESGKESRVGVRILKSDNNELVASAMANKPIEVVQGAYNIEVGSMPKQDKKAVSVNAGEEAVIEFKVQAPAAPQVPRAAPLPPKNIKK